MTLDNLWPWRVKLSKNGKRGEVYGPDGRYRGALTAEKASALVAELNAIDPRVAELAARATESSQ